MILFSARTARVLACGATVLFSGACGILFPLRGLPARDDAGTDNDGDVPLESEGAVCGNGAVESGEDCDDGKNGDPDDGCRDDCAYSCRDSDDCDDDDPCTADACSGIYHWCTHYPSRDGAGCGETVEGHDATEDDVVGDRGEDADGDERAEEAAADAIGDADTGDDGTEAPHDTGSDEALHDPADPAGEDVGEGATDTGTEDEGDGGGPSLTPGFVFVPAGTFMMGSPAGEPGRDTDEAEHAVTLTVSFEMKAREVTQAEFAARIGRTPSYFSSCGTTCPVDQASWHEALDYANLFSLFVGKAQCFDCTGSTTAGVTCSLKTAYSRPQDCPGFRLPTEAEWEYAARATTTSAYHDGFDSDSGHLVCETPCHLTDIAWYCANASSTPHAVGGKAANRWGIFDMSGNLREWAWDWYGTYPGTVSDYWGPGTGSGRVVRGGGYSTSASNCRVADRGDNTPELHSRFIGFRLVRSLL